MPKLPVTPIVDLTNGLVTAGAVADSQFPLNAVSESINFNFDRIGTAQLRKGTTLLGNQLSGNILGLYEFRDSGSGTNNQIIAVNGSTVYYLSGGTWVSKRTVTSDKKARFSTFLDYVFMVNGTDATAVWDGSSSSFATTGNATDAPIGKYIENFRSRMWIAGNSTYPDRLYYSDLPSSVTTPVIVWDTDVATGNWIDISPSDGENITGLKRSKTFLLVFKNNHIYRVASIQETEPDPIINVGTYSQESIVEAKDGTYFHHPTGIYRYSGGMAEYISQPIVDFISNVSATEYENICGWTDGDHVFHALGNVTVGDVTYTNVVTRYTISSKVWTVYSYPTRFFVSSPYNDGSTLFRLVGDDGGNILKMDTGITDNGTPIFYSLILSPRTLDGLFSTRKNISKMAVIHEGGQGSVLTVRIGGMGENEWKKLHSITEKVPTPFTVDIKANKVYFRIQGVSVGEPFTIGGLEVLESESEIIG